MAKIDQATRRGRLVTVFIGGLLVFGSITLAGFYLSHQRKMQFESTQNGSQIANLDENDEEITDTGDDQGQDEATNDQEASNDSSGEEATDEETTDSVAVTGPSASDEEGEDETAAGTTQLPHTGPSDGEGTPSEIPATGPELLWVVAIVGGLVVSYLSFEYRRSRLAFQRAALRRE